MPVFQYRAATASGELRGGAVDAPDAAAALARLQRDGLRPIEVKPAAASKPGKAKLGRGARPAIAKAFAELSVLAGAGLSLERALAIVSENLEDAAVRALFTTLRERVKEGATLARGVEEAGNAFPPMAAPMIAAGEASGALDVALVKLADTLERSEQLRQAIVSAMIYPVMLSAVATAVILLMLLFVVPNFEGLFGNAGDRLPAMTKLTVAASHFVRDWGLVVVFVAIVLGFVARGQLRRPAVRRAWDRRVLAIPKLGMFVSRIETARFTRVFGSLISGGVPLPAALALARRTLTNDHLAKAIGAVEIAVKQGAGLAGPLAASGLFPRVMISFVRTGEETAELGRMLDRLADVLDLEVRTVLGRIIALLTPAITVIMGIVVAFVIASLMTAILGFNNLAMEQ
jgi:general secretion pathway protein F